MTITLVFDDVENAADYNAELFQAEANQIVTKLNALLPTTQNVTVTVQYGTDGLRSPLVNRDLCLNRCTG